MVDDEGSLVGRIVRVDIDPSSGGVTSIDVRKGATLGFGGQTTTVASDDIVTVGTELVTIRHAG